MKMTEKAAYLKGLADGLEYDKTTKEGKLIAALLDMVDALAEKVDGLDYDVQELNDYVEELDEDLGDVEELLLYDEDEEDECDGDCDNCCLDCELDDFDDFDDDEDFSDEDFFEIVCPACGDTVCFDASIDPENLACPACGEKFECIVDEDDLKAIDGVSDEE